MVWTTQQTLVMLIQQWQNSRQPWGVTGTQLSARWRCSNATINILLRLNKYLEKEFQSWGCISTWIPVPANCEMLLSFSPAEPAALRQISKNLSACSPRICQIETLYWNLSLSTQLSFSLSLIPRDTAAMFFSVYLGSDLHPFRFLQATTYFLNVIPQWLNLYKSLKVILICMI